MIWYVYFHALLFGLEGTITTPNQLPPCSCNPIGSTLLVAPKRSPHVQKWGVKRRIPFAHQKRKKKERKKRKKKGIPPHALCYLIIILTLIINFRIIRWLWIDSLVRVFWYTTSSLIFGIGDACSLGIGPGRPPILNGWERYIKYFDMLFPLRIWCVHNILMELHENWHACVKNMHIFH